MVAHPLALRVEPGVPDLSGARRGSAWRDTDGIERGQAFVTDTSRWLVWHDVGTFAFSPTSPDVRVWPTAGVSLERVRAEFGRIVQPLILQALGQQVLHASAAAGPDGVIAFCGLSGSGKSTLSYAVAARPTFAHFADDSLLWREQDGRPLAMHLPFSSSLRIASRVFFDTRPAAVPWNGAADDLPLAALFVLRQNGTTPWPAVVPIASTRAFTTVLAHAHCFDAESRDEVARLTSSYLTLVEHVPVFDISYRPHFPSLDRLVDAVVSASASGR